MMIKQDNTNVSINLNKMRNSTDIKNSVDEISNYLLKVIFLRIWRGPDERTIKNNNI